MSETKTSRGAVQNTGNTVFDSTVNLLMNTHFPWNTETIPQVYEALLDIYEREVERKQSGGTKRVSMSELQERAKR
jgi:hypothetical protein